MIKIQWFHRFDVKNFKTTQNCKSNQITMNYIYITQNDQKCCYVAKHSKQRKTTSIWRQNEQNVELRRKPFKTAKLQKWSKYNDFHRFDVKNFKTTLQKWSNYMNFFDLMFKRSKQRKTTKVIKLRWICIDLMSKTSKQRKTAKVIKLQWITSI